jgi:hypothetical protein
MIAYKDAFALLDDPVMQIRIQYAMLHAAAYILIEALGTPGHANRVDWAHKAFREQLQMPLRQVMLYVITDANVQTAGAGATDTQLQGAIDALLPTLVSGG